MENNLSIVKDKFKELPNNIEAEQSVIGSILVTNEIFDEINTIVSSNNFYDPMHQKIFEAIESLIYKGMLANPITLKNYFEDEKDELNVPEYLVKITKFSTSVRQSVEYSKIIYDMFKSENILDFSMGWGDRLAGFYASEYGKHYVGLDPRGENHPIYKEQSEFYEKHLGFFEHDRKSEFHCSPAEDFEEDMLSLASWKITSLKLSSEIF